MSAVDKIMFAEERVAELQSHLSTVETVLERVEQVAVAGEQAGSALRRLLQIVLLISIVAAVVMIVKKIMGDGCLFSAAADDADPVSDAAVDDEVLGDSGAPPSGDADAS